jgi:hypothetical protein
MVRARLLYTYQGDLSILVPRVPDRPASEAGCRQVNVTEPVLIPIPRTRVDWIVEAALL